MKVQQLKSHAAAILHCYALDHEHSLISVHVVLCVSYLHPNSCMSCHAHVWVLWTGCLSAYQRARPPCSHMPAAGHVVHAGAEPPRLPPCARLASPPPPTHTRVHPQAAPEASMALLPYAFPVLSERLQYGANKAPVEPCEEVRLGLAQLLYTLIGLSDRWASGSTPTYTRYGQCVQ